MGQVLHGSATTTEAVRRAIQHSQESLRALARRYGVNPKTVAKWKGRTSVADLRTGPKEARSSDRHADLAKRIAGAGDRYAPGPSGDRLWRLFHVRRRQSGTPCPVFRRALDRRQSSDSRRRPCLAFPEGHAGPMDRSLVPSFRLFLAVRTTLAAALSDPRQSFAILPYGCSCATIMEGVLEFTAFTRRRARN